MIDKRILLQSYLISHIPCYTVSTLQGLWNIYSLVCSVSLHQANQDGVCLQQMASHVLRQRGDFLRFVSLNSLRSPHIWRWCLDDFAHLMPVLLITNRRASCPEGVFPCKYTADGRNDKCRLRFRRECLTAAFRKFPRALEIWAFRPRSLASHLSYPPFCPQWNSARKTAFPATKPERVSQKGKELKLKTFKTSDYACKENDNRTRAEVRH